MRFIHILNVVAAVPWCIAMALMAINWSMGEPVTPVGRLCCVIALTLMTFGVLGKAIDGIEAIILARCNNLDRRPGRGK